jgi:hypothetical protein
VTYVSPAQAFIPPSQSLRFSQFTACDTLVLGCHTPGVTLVHYIHTYIHNIMNALPKAVPKPQPSKWPNVGHIANTGQPLPKRAAQCAPEMELTEGPQYHNAKRSMEYKASYSAPMLVLVPEHATSATSDADRLACRQPLNEWPVLSSRFRLGLRPIIG